jgi:hypothetical protein
MGERIRCFLLSPTPYAQETLRRFKFSAPGEDHVHSAVTTIGVVPFPLEGPEGEPAEGVDTGDPRWPEACACRYRFTPEDEYQHRLTRLYWQGNHAAMRVTLRDAPVGSMWRADWYPWKGPDGHCLVIRTPGGDWLVDKPNESEDRWHRTGDPPNLTVQGSILFPGKYHGFLVEGYLVEC